MAEVTPGTDGINEGAVPTLEDYELTVAALGDLGVTSALGQQIPEFEAVTAAFTPAATYLGEHTGRGDRPELTFHIPLAGGYDLYRLIAEFDEQQELKTAVRRELWDIFRSHDHNMGETHLRPSMLLNDTTDPANRTRPANDDYGEVGLVYVGQTVQQERISLTTEQKGANQKGADLQPIGITEYIVAQAKRRQAGLRLMDVKLGIGPPVTRFLQYPEQNIDAGIVVPRVSLIPVNCTWTLCR